MRYQKHALDITTGFMYAESMNSTSQAMNRKKHRREKRCLSCGTTQNLGRRKYCSNTCRQKLQYALDIRTGLLRALNTRYATFYFTEIIIVMDLLPHGSKEIFRNPLRV